MPRVEAITFDFWNTLVVDGGGAARDARLDAWLGILEDAGFAVEREAVDAAMASAWERFLRKWRTNEQYTHVEAAVDIVEQLGYRLPPGVHEALVSSFTYATSNYPTLTDGIGACLHRLREGGIRIGIICDVGMTPSRVLREILDHNGLLSSFDHWSFSDEVGHYKPAPEIFHHAMDGLGVTDPARMAHIGDLKRTDVAGALGMGMLALRYTGAFDDAESEGIDADVIVASHADVPAAIGLG